MDIEAKDKYIADHLMKLEPDTLRFMVADLTAEVDRLTALCDGYRDALEKAHKALLEVDDCQGSACCIPERSVYMVCQEAATAVKAALQKEGR